LQDDACVWCLTPSQKSTQVVANWMTMKAKPNSSSFQEESIDGCNNNADLLDSIGLDKRGRPRALFFYDGG